MATPMVGITWTADVVRRSAGAGENALKYAAILIEAGLTPVLVTPQAGAGMLARLDGLMVPGGPDVGPSRYGQEAGELLGAVVPELDDLEVESVHAARARNLPIFGICRGQQLINVALGGTLHQHVDHPQWAESAPSLPVHEVEILAGTHLRRTLGVEVASVNSGHHQAVDVVAPSLRISARSADGCIEGLEAEALLITTVQWHPEEMPGEAGTRLLLAAFARWCGRDVRAQDS